MGKREGDITTKCQIVWKKLAEVCEEGDPMLGHLRCFYSVGTRQLFRSDIIKPTTFVILDTILCNHHICGKQQKEFL